jgi:hypothetical protein
VLTLGDRVVRATSASSTQIIVGNGLFRSTGDGGPARDAPVYDVMGVAADAAGNVYFTERDGHRVRKVSPAGVVSTIAGTGAGGCSGDGGPAIAAQLFLPYGIVADSSGGLYIVGCGVQHITPDGVIASVSQTLSSDLALDPQGNLYVAQFPGVVVRISPDGLTTPIAGSGIPDGNKPEVGELALNATMGPSSTAVDAAGNVYIADQLAKSIWIVNSSGIIISRYADLDATRLALDAAGNLYAIGTDSRVYRVQPGEVFPIDGLTDVVALTVGSDSRLLIAQEMLDRDPLHADSVIRHVGVAARRPARR